MACVLTRVTDVTDATHERDDGDADEKALVCSLQRGDVLAFDRAYSLYSARVFSFLLRLSGRRDTAEDLAQETWIKLAKAAPSLRDDTRLGPFLFTIARNAFISHRRWSMLDLSRVVTMGFDTITAISSDPGPDEEHEHSRAIQLLERALQGISLGSREVLLLIGVEGLEQDEVAKILDVSYDALRKRLSRARKELTDKMDSLEKRNATATATKKKTRTGDAL